MRDNHLEYGVISVSIVCHGHGAMVERLVEDLLNYPEIGQIIVTLNIPDLLMLPQDDRILAINNPVPAGFGANHNAASEYCALPYFCALNPDIHLLENPFPALLAAMRETDAALAAPLVRNPSGDIEDSIRIFPTIRSLLSKSLGLANGCYKIKDGQAVFYPDWVAGMFMIFRSADFRALGGFDARFFLYYEDVDICARIWQAKKKVLACPVVSVIHDARRASRREFWYMCCHLASMVRYFCKYWRRLPSLPDRG